VAGLASGAWGRRKILAGRSPRYKASGQVRRHLAADLGDGLIYREAFTTSAAEQVIDHLVNACGLRPDHGSVPAPGKIVFVYHQARDTGLGIRDTGVGDGDSGERGDAQATPRSDQALLHKLAA
jgi:hypothetical protein